MKLTLNRDQFVHALSQVMGVVGSKATMPILGNVLITAVRGEPFVSLLCTNLDYGIRCQVKAEVVVAGAVTLPVRRLVQIVRELPNEEVILDVSAAFQAKITSGSSTFRIMGLAKDEFPPMPAIDESQFVSLPQGDLATMIRNVEFAQSTDETRYVLNGTFFSFQKGGLTLVATDGRRLARSVKTFDECAAKEGTCIIPARSIGELARLLNSGTTVKFQFNDRRAAFLIQTDKDKEGLTGEIYLFSKVVEGNFPNYNQVIPKSDGRVSVKFERELLLNTVHRASLVCSEKANSVALSFGKDRVEITAKSPDFGEVHEQAAIIYDGPEVKVAFNPVFLTQPLSAVTKDEVMLEIGNDSSPGVFRDGNGFTCVVMPVRLN
jgi:DNA polymerase-3 subunit beta